jgi:heat-inducible transcriptional repressor
LSRPALDASDPAAYLPAAGTLDPQSASRDPPVPGRPLDDPIATPNRTGPALRDDRRDETVTRPAPLPEITDRERAVLATVVRGYVGSAHAVGSRWVARHSGLDLSPASIRNCMMDLEEKGLLTHLHTSGGRLPTNAGYRLFVDELMRRTPVGRRVERSIDDALSVDRHGSLEGLLDAACTVLGRLSDQLSVVLSPRYDRSVVDRLGISQVDERRVLVVFRMVTGLERTVIVSTSSAVASDDLGETVRVMNAIAPGKTFGELLAAKDSEENRVRLRGLSVAHAVFRGAEELRRRESDAHFHLWGTSNILSQPEFADRERLAEIFRALEAKEILTDLFEPTRHRRGVSIAIGDEIPVEELRACSIVANSYRFGDYGGTVGVIGPTRMPYEFVVSLVDRVAEAVGRNLVRN